MVHLDQSVMGCKTACDTLGGGGGDSGGGGGGGVVGGEETRGLAGSVYLSAYIDNLDRSFGIGARGRVYSKQKQRGWVWGCWVRCGVGFRRISSLLPPPSISPTFSPYLVRGRAST